MSLSARGLQLCVLLFAVCAAAAPDPALASEKNFKDRLNRIFFWQLSDELKLSPDEEKQMSKILEENQFKREKSLTDREATMRSILAHHDKLHKESKSAATAEDTALVAGYIKQLQALAAVDQEEVASLRKVLGDRQAVHFLAVREQILERVREVLKKTRAKENTQGGL